MALRAIPPPLGWKRKNMSWWKLESKNNGEYVNIRKIRWTIEKWIYMIATENEMRTPPHIIPLRTYWPASGNFDLPRS